MYQFIQLTDLHIGDNNTEEFENLDRIITNIINNYAPDICPLILITGDFVHNGSVEEYNQVIGLLRKLKTAGFKVLACPGNHDFGQGSVGNKFNYQPDVRNRYLQYIHNDLLNEDRSVAEWEGGKTFFPVVTPINDKRVLFVGLDSMHGVLDEKVHYATGKVDWTQMSKAINELKKPAYSEYIKVVYLHHSLYSARPFLFLKEREKLEDELNRAGVKMVCFGHTHRFEEYTSSGHTDAMRSVCGGKITEEFRENGISHRLEYYHYSIDETENKVTMNIIRFD